MAMYLLRVQLPDRPGALGAVASRIGAVRADVVALDIVGRGEGRAVDEFVVELAEESHVSLLLSEVAEVDGVEVEELRVLPSDVTDRRLDPYETAAALLKERSRQGVLRALADRSRRELSAGWAAVLDHGLEQLVSFAGRPPDPAWLAAYVAGTRWHGHQADSPRGEGEPRPPVLAEVAWADLKAWDLILAVGRPSWPFGPSERQRLEAIARLGDLRWSDLAELEARATTPSRVG